MVHEVSNMLRKYGRCTFGEGLLKEQMVYERVDTARAHRAINR